MVLFPNWAEVFPKAADTQVFPTPPFPETDQHTRSPVFSCRFILDKAISAVVFLYHTQRVCTSTGLNIKFFTDNALL